MPLAARFADGSHFGAIDHFDPIFFASYYPANSEVVHAVPLLAYGRDILSPLINLAWLALGLTAAYAIGRPYGVGPQSLIGGAIALGAQNLVEFQAGEALNDIVGVSLILCAVAVLVNAWAARTTTGNEGEGRRETVGIRRKLVDWPAIATAGLAAGLAAGTKLSLSRPRYRPVRGPDRHQPDPTGQNRPSGSPPPPSSPAATGTCATRSRSATRFRTRASGRSACPRRSGPSSCAPATRCSTTRPTSTSGRTGSFPGSTTRSASCGRW